MSHITNLQWDKKMVLTVIPKMNLWQVPSYIYLSNCLLLNHASDNKYVSHFKLKYVFSF